MTARATLFSVLLAALLVAFGGATPAAAQAAQNPPNALQGFSVNRELPVKIEAASLEVRDKSKIATFFGNVLLTQGDTTLKCKTLVVHYDDTPATPAAQPKGMKAATPGPGGSQQIKRVEAKGDVVVSQKDQTATGNNGVFDLKANTVTLTGNVIVTQGQNVLRGEKLVVDLATGRTTVESGKGRVEGLFLPNSAKELRATPKGEQPKEQPKPPARGEAPKPAPTGPMRIN